MEWLLENGSLGLFQHLNETIKLSHTKLITILRFYSRYNTRKLVEKVITFLETDKMQCNLQNWRKNMKNTGHGPVSITSIGCREKWSENSWLVDRREVSTRYVLFINTVCIFYTTTTQGVSKIVNRPLLLCFTPSRRRFFLSQIAMQNLLFCILF